MAENLYAVGDIGATNLRLAIYNDVGEWKLSQETRTDPQDYEGTVERLTDIVTGMHPGRGEVVAASVAVAAEVGEDGVLTRSGGLSPWIGKNLGHDIGEALGLADDLVGTPNDVVAIALSQQHVNRVNGQPVEGIATTLSSGWGGALYWGEGRTQSDEPGHEHLRDGATCPCGGEGHAEAHVSGNGILQNQGVDMRSWLANEPGAQQQLVTDLSEATIAMIDRVEDVRDPSFEAQELRWTGGVALGQPFIMGRVADNIRGHFMESQRRQLVVDTVTAGEHAGLHGTFIDAQDRAARH